MNDVKCDCGHVNPHGTVLCESCGKVLGEQENGKALLDMRYEGSARRSQTYNKTIIDKIWNFFSSVKVGVWLIVITLSASSLGTIFPQEMYIPPVMPASEYYQDQYGWMGNLYYQLGFHNLYSSWWYLILIASIGVSLVICSLDRVIPLYRALKKQRVSRHESYLKRQRIFGMTDTNEIGENDFDRIKQNLKARRYKLREENGDILAEKGRFSRWGPYVNHVGLIIFLIGAMLRFVPGMYVDETLWVREGETKVIPETDGQYYLTNDQFILEVYDKDKDKEVFEEAIERSGMVAKNFQSNVSLYKKQGDTVAGEEPELKKVKDYEIRVNDPLKFENFALYQVEYKLNELNKMSFILENKESKEAFGNLTIDLYDPENVYDLGNGYSVEIVQYYPDYEISDGEPITKSKIPNNPAFVFKMVTPDTPEGEVSFVAIRKTIEPSNDNQYKMTFNGVETKNVSALTVRKDLTLWIISLGGAIFMIGVVQGAYWNHRRIWFRQMDGKVWVAAHTNKNWFGLKKEITTALKGTGIQEPGDQLQNEKEV
ncbi:cytochrome C biogenesis protein [Bacillus canaveralius]|uniref:Cytochrome C biogenesis protein n=1 Tax=Bacillus canaveralius TaxID=1403243 RepID=A0A2N5GRN6_9BACI|nr:MULTISPECIES: cytochrome c biogenesis protein ResB [Bacillus]PLR84580.1 cytochrome C biogenesis protein [Bacillus sp. V33-4]PLR86094.1 cytochrome C biogenesis protein [Bacillus canaveralius]PLS00214.1 cytochrome C biogenesis protein [Bacillus canaveralius]RSK52022.1 cytochrome C biogenesis protein [Bacillus canaveralius]